MMKTRPCEKWTESRPAARSGQCRASRQAAWGPRKVAVISECLSFARRRPAIILWTVASTILIEALTIYLRFGRGVTAAEFNKTAPLLLQIHHMFYSIPLLLAVLFLWRRPRLSSAALGHRLGHDPQRPFASFPGASVDRGQYGLALAVIDRSNSLVLSLQRIGRRPKRNSQLIVGQEVGAFFPRTFRRCLSRR